MVASTLLALALAPEALAADIKIKNIRVRQTGDSNYRVVVVVDDESDEVADVSASVAAGDAGETVPLERTDAWLHGTAALATLPGSDAAATLTLYDVHSDAIASFSGSLTRMKRDDYCGTGLTCASNLEVVSTAAYAATAGYEVGLDLSGSDARLVAYGKLAYRDAKGATWDAEVAWDAVGTVYEGDTKLADIAVDVTVTATDAVGATLDRATTELVPAWDDGASGTSALAMDEDPLTSFALDHNGAKELADILENQYRTVIVSDGWALGDTLPTYAEVSVDDGEIWEIPANSYQLAAATPVKFAGDPSAEAFYVTVNGKTFDAATPVGGRGLCQHGTCVALVEEADGTWTLAATAYAQTSAALPKSVTVALSPSVGKAYTSEKAYTMSYDAEVAVVFAAEVGVVGDPDGLDVSGKVRLRGRSILFVGHFAGQLGADGDGDLGLAAIPHGGPVASKGDILVGGEPIEIELTSDKDGDGVLDGPPAVVRKDGSGTRRVATTSNQTQPQLL